MRLTFAALRDTVEILVFEEGKPMKDHVHNKIFFSLAAIAAIALGVLIVGLWPALVNSAERTCPLELRVEEHVRMMESRDGRVIAKVTKPSAMRYLARMLAPTRPHPAAISVYMTPHMPMAWFTFYDASGCEIDYMTVGGAFVKQVLRDSGHYPEAAVDISKQLW